MIGALSGMMWWRRSAGPDYLDCGAGRGARGPLDIVGGVERLIGVSRRPVSACLRNQALKTSLCPFCRKLARKRGMAACICVSFMGSNSFT